MFPLIQKTEKGVSLALAQTVNASESRNTCKEEIKISLQLRSSTKVQIFESYLTKLEQICQHQVKEVFFGLEHTASVRYLGVFGVIYRIFMKQPVESSGSFFSLVFIICSTYLQPWMPESNEEEGSKSGFYISSSFHIWELRNVSLSFWSCLVIFCIFFYF